ncbi:NAD-dependent epimerase/dehydratase family protein [Butyrivibrio sp. XPD2006]|uniref:NAD-dependent epimerase/dehydratase family protein n=1 Tax=Butyrivibrio sp. XPD2006 TaxID=1280668 RepID=UPI0003B30B1E|nr:NAD(P)-dependent oxidoreductase [Butyrivibrio sp. XPD2006]
MQKCLVTGANGFIGSELLKVLSDEGVEVIAVVRSRHSNIDKIKNLKGVSIVYCDMDDIHNLPQIVVDRDIDTCIHLAWIGSFGEERGYYEMQLRNVRYALQLVDSINQMGIKRFVGAGTLAEKDVLNYHGEDGAKPNPVSFYGIAKVTTHYMTKTECARLGIEHVWCYLSNTYAVGSTTNNFVMMASRTMLEGRRAAFTSGEQTYDFMYVTDTVKAIYYASSRGKAFTSYYLGSNSARPLKEYIRIIRDTIDPSIDLFLGEIPFNGNPLPTEAYDGSKLERDTGFKPEIDFEEGIKKTVDWLKSTM